MTHKRNIVNNNDKTKIKPLFDSVVGRTSDMMKEAADYTGISIRTIQRYYRGAGAMPTSTNLMKLLSYFSMKFDREVKLEEILVQPKSVNHIADLSLTAFGSKKRKSKLNTQ